MVNANSENYSAVENALPLQIQFNLYILKKPMSILTNIDLHCTYKLASRFNLAGLKIPALCYLFLITFFACSTASDAVLVKEVAVTDSGNFSGLGVESKDIDRISKEMVRDLFAADFYKNATATPIIILEGEYFINESSNIINTNLLADKMRVQLVREGKGSFNFVSRRNLNLLIKEAETSGKDINIIEADYRMIARISSIHNVSNKTGLKSSYFQFAFELLNLETSSLVWANIYNFKKVGSDDTIYR